MDAASLACAPNYQHAFFAEELLRNRQAAQQRTLSQLPGLHLISWLRIDDSVL